ncbi:MAG: hypothetical protein WA398_11480, partial [Nitrososphaeraceae archaeon]
ITLYVESIFPPNSGVVQLPPQANDVQGERQSEQEDSDLIQLSSFSSNGDLIDTYNKENYYVVIPEGRISEEGDWKDSSAKIERAMIIYNQVGASK